METTVTLPETSVAPESLGLEDEISFWDGKCSEAMRLCQFQGGYFFS